MRKSTMIESLTNFNLYFCFSCILVITLTGSNAQTRCEIFQWKCQNGECIQSEKRCDGKATCSDSSDETPETCGGVVCPRFTTKCSYGACIASVSKCNGLQNCADNSDEQNCSPMQIANNTIKGRCNANKFPCSRVFSDDLRWSYCIDTNQICDGKRDCTDGYDESRELCASGGNCQGTDFQCDYGACIARSGVCNGVRDCDDGSDETPELCNPPKPDTRSCPAIFDDPNISAVHAYDNSVLVNDGEIIGEFREIIYRCRRTYVLYGAKDNQCLNGQWRYPIPKCSRVCSPEAINGVTFSSKCKFGYSETPCTGLIRPNTRVDLACSIGYKKPLRNVPETILCSDTGDWDYHPASCEPECGQLTVTATPFINGGYPVNITKVPWHTAIYKSTGGAKYEHICGGTVYSAKLVISAAHCFWDVRRDVAEDKRFFTVAVGKVFRSYNAAEPLFTQFFNLSEIHIPFSYGGAGRSYENDIAMLVLDNHIVYKDHIKPICIRWFQYAQREVKPGTIGRIAGWGKININNEFGEDLKAVDLPAFSKEQCLKDDRTYSTYVTGEKFCVGAPDDETVCQGDSGGGYVVKNEETGTPTYYLWGVLSVGLGNTCERDHLTTFTNVQYHKEMITDYEIRHRPK